MNELELRNPKRAPGPVRHYSAGRHLTPQRYVIGWQDGVVKVGETWHGSRRWGRFIASGGIMLDLAYYEDLGDALRGETWLQRQLRRTYRGAFPKKEDSIKHLGKSGGGYCECFAIPPEDWPKIIQLARS